MMRIKKKGLSAVTVVSVIALGCFIAHKRWEYNLLKEIRETPPEKKARMIAKNYEFALAHVRVGMTKQQVEKAIGPPQNTDNEYVWAWAFPNDVPLKGDEGWIDLMRCGDDIISIVFWNGKVIGSPLGIESGASMPPPNLVMVTQKCDMRTALELLGVAPKDIEEYLYDENATRRLWAEKYSTQKPQKENLDANPQSSGSQE